MDSESDDHTAISEITIANGKGYGYFPYNALRFNKFGLAEYYAGKYCDNPGFYTGHIDSVKWNSIAAVLKAIEYDTLHQYYPNNEDCTAMEILIKDDTSRFHVDGGTCAFGRELESSLGYIFSLKDSIQWAKQNDSIIFETTVQNFKTQKFPVINIK